jgi:hypothetical protein
MTDRTVMTSFRIPAKQLAEITRRAERAGMSRSAYLIAAALGELNVPGVAERVEALERRVEALESQRQ